MKTPSAARTGLRSRLMAWFMAQGLPDNYEKVVTYYKSKFLTGLDGTVVEIGPGTGENFPYFSATVQWIGIEPNVFMHRYLEKAAARYGFEADIRVQSAESLELEDKSADSVISTFVLCSVGEQRVALQEIKRVLKPGGRFIFIEHVGAPAGTATRRMQRAVRPVWRFFGDGCHIDRDTAQVIQDTGFADVQIEHFNIPHGLIGPHIAGVAINGES